MAQAARASCRPHRPRRAVLATLTALGGLLAGTLSGAPAATAAGPGAVSHVQATPAGSTAVRLTWHDRAGQLATVVRWATAPGAPSSPTAGHRGGRAGAGRTALVVRGLRPATRYAFALFAYYGAGRYGARAVVRIRTAPDSVRLVQPYLHGGRVTITWSPPAATTYAGTVVRFAAGGSAPSSPRAGIGVRLAGSHASSADLPPLVAGATYAVAVWTRDRAHRYSSVATTRFTTLRAYPIPTGTVHGTVTDAAHRPLAGVAVSVLRSGDAAARATTAADGSYSLAAPAGSVTVLFDGAQATGGATDATGYQRAGRPIVLTAGGSLTENAALASGAAIAGQLTDLHGNPLTGVALHPRQPQPYVSAGGFSVSFAIDEAGAPTTGADGRYLLKGLPASALQVCYDTTTGPVTGGASDAMGYVGRCERGAVAVPAGTTRTLPATALPPAGAGAVSGTITDAAGHAVAGVLVELSMRGGSGAGFGSATTDAAGHYRALVPPGRYDVCADPAPVAVPLGGAGRALTCRFGAAAVSAGRTAVVDVQLRAAGAVAGRLRGPHGTPVSGALVVALSQGGTVAGSEVTGAHGEYALPDLAPGWYRVCFDTTQLSVAGAPGGVLPECYRGGDLVQVRRGTVRLGVDAAPALAGAVAGRVTGTAGNATVVEVSRPGDEQSTAFGFADAAGRYVVPAVPTGRYLVCALSLDVTTGPGQACHHSTGARQPTPVPVRAGVVTRPVNVALPAAGTLTATVVDEGGHPVSGVDVAVVADCGQEGDCGPLPVFDANRPVRVAGSAMTGERGRARLTHLPPSRHYAVCLLTYYGAAPTGDPATGYLDSCTSHGSFGVSVAAGQDSALAFTVHPAGAVRGTVTDGHGHPLAGVRVRVSDSTSSDFYDPASFGDPFGFGPGGPADEVTTDPDGTYLVRGVRPGGRTVCFDPGDAVDVTGAAHPTGLLGQCVGGTPGNVSHGTLVTVPAAATVSGVDQQLADGAVITGRVLDRSTGRPIGDAAVLVFAGQDLVTATATDGRGRYRIGDLAPGHLHVCFAAYPYAGQCYDGVPWPMKSVPATAAVVTTTSGATVTLKDARLRRG